MDVEVPGYRLGHLVAEGGMASVYLAVQESLNRNVALKLLKKFDTPGETERFLNEGRIISSLNHRNVITIHDIGTVGGRPFISMEYLEGGDLEDRLRDGIDPDAALKLAGTIAECLDFVHERGIIHRDIKPANILFHEDGTAILTDFGIAKELRADSSLTMDGTALGSPYYLSPEQAEGKPVDGRADIYSLGVLFYQMLMGERPYDGDSAVEVLVGHLREPVPELPPHLQRYQPLLNRMMAKSPEARFSSAGALLRELNELRDSRSGSALQVSPRVSFGHRLVAAARARRARIAIGTACSGLAAMMLFLGGGVPGLPGGTRLSPEPASIVGSEPVPPTAAADAESRPDGPAEERDQPENVFPTVAIPKAAREPVAAAGMPANSAATDSDPFKQRQIETYLESARTALADLRLTTPRGDSASFYFQRVLDLAPDNPEARQGIVRVADAYADLVEGALERFAYADARRYLARGLRVQPDNPRLLELKRRAAVHRDAPKRMLNKLKSWM